MPYSAPFAGIEVSTESGEASPEHWPSSNMNSTVQLGGPRPQLVLRTLAAPLVISLGFRGALGWLPAQHPGKRVALQKIHRFIFFYRSAFIHLFLWFI